MNAGVIGMGKMGLLHSGIINSMNNVDLVSISDSSSFILKSIKTLIPSINTYRNYQKMLDEEDLDVVFITTPVFLHVPMAIECIDRDIPFFIEKPLSISTKEGKDLINKLRNKKIINMVGYCKRYVKSYIMAKEVIDSNILGDLSDFEATMYVSQVFKKGKGWRYDKSRSGGGVLNGVATHLIDLLLWLFGEVTSVQGTTKRIYSEEVEDHVHASIEFETNLKGLFDSSWSVKNYRIPEAKISINAENGKLVVTDDKVDFYLENEGMDFKKGWNRFSKQHLWESVYIDIGGPEYTREDLDFIRAIMNNKPVESDVIQGLKTQKVVSAIYESASSGGKEVRLNGGQK